MGGDTISEYSVFHTIVPSPSPLWSPSTSLIKAGYYSTYGGYESVPAIVDPISTIYCKCYIPREANLKGRGIYRKNWESDIIILAQQYTYCMSPALVAQQIRNKVCSGSAIRYFGG
jgi:hypothetical protein